MRNALKAWVVLQKKLSPLEYVPGCGALSQEHCFAQVKIKIAIKFENWLRCCDELQRLGKPSYYTDTFTFFFFCIVFFSPLIML